MKHYKIKKKEQSILRRLPPNVGQLNKTNMPRRLFTDIQPVAKYKLVDPQPIDAELPSNIRDRLTLGLAN